MAEPTEAVSNEFGTLQSRCDLLRFTPSPEPSAPPSQRLGRRYCEGCRYGRISGRRDDERGNHCGAGISRSREGAT
jgi:hypothetical protein